MLISKGLILKLVFLRKYSRHQRRNWFLTTAPPTYLGIVHPHLISPKVFCRKAKINQLHGRIWRPVRDISRKSERHLSLFSRPCELFTTNGYRQAFAAFRPATRKNLLSIFSSHSWAKAVGLFSASSTWLISSFHIFQSPLFLRLFPTAYSLFKTWCAIKP